MGAIGWELRAAWASGRRVALSLDERSSRRRVEGCVDRVAATGAFVAVAGIHVPLQVILAVHLPSRLGDSTIVASEQWARSRRRLMAQPDALPAMGGPERAGLSTAAFAGRSARIHRRSRRASRA